MHGKHASLSSANWNRDGQGITVNWFNHHVRSQGSRTDDQAITSSGRGKNFFSLRRVEQCSWLLAIQTTEGRRQDTSWTSSREKQGFWQIQGTNESNGRVYISRFAQLTMQGNCISYSESPAKKKKDFSLMLKLKRTKKHVTIGLHWIVVTINEVSAPLMTSPRTKP